MIILISILCNATQRAVLKPKLKMLGFNEQFHEDDRFRWLLLKMDHTFGHIHSMSMFDNDCPWIASDYNGCDAVLHVFDAHDVRGWR